ncbi:hypothetical protein [Persicitalea jodogahamensis]|uniref:Uncharacterized protein n=1 Tax=Persicitalea jodogahamensis TaxID=402147 RepID=A0A8J3D0Z7_9BACT|nr:hypothetical protein [Persicitalea jodogahamensis]GHB54106.1 hypothetical protein GCM10007390_03810 [Persicitalea jodogahamensis]
MISFDSPFNSSDFLHWVLLILLAAFLTVVAGILWKNKTLPPRRKWIKGLLNLLLWLVLLGYFMQPTWTTTTDSRRAMLVGQEVPNAVARQYQDSLGLKERFGAQEFLKKKLVNNFDSLTLLGQDFAADLLSQIGSGAVDWQPYFTRNQIQNLSWQGILRQGEWQRISGVVNTSEKQWIKIKYAGETLDSVEISEKQKSFSLTFPAFSEGRTSIELFLESTFVDTLRFFVRPRPVLSYQFILDNPDFESRTLAEWLGRRGDAVTINTTVSKGIQQSTTINEGVEKDALPDVIITDASNAANSQVKKVLAAGKSVLFIGTTQPEANFAIINRALGTGFSVRRNTTETLIRLQPNLTALPYKFNESLPQLLTPNYPVAVWRKVGKVGVSLLNETFPLKLSGDSVAYAKVWDTILAQVQPPLKSMLLAEAPLFKCLSGDILINADLQLPGQLQVGQDTLALSYSPLNEYSAKSQYFFGQAGWLALGDSAEVFVEDSTSALFLTRRMNDYVRAQRAARFSAVTLSSKPQRQQKVDDWIWLVLFVMSCTALWVEPKL